MNALNMWTIGQDDLDNKLQERLKVKVDEEEEGNIV